MIGCVDVHYRGNTAAAALVLFSDWRSDAALATYTQRIDSPAPYVPGQFYKRELPCLLSALKAASQQPDLLLIDGYVWLEVDDTGLRQPGLGAHLYDALNKRIPIIGAAKTHYKNSDAIPIYRGNSKRPIYISAVGIDAQRAAEHVQSMNGADRLPTMIKLADQLARKVPG